MVSASRILEPAGIPRKRFQFNFPSPSTRMSGMSAPDRLPTRDRLIVALDFASADAAARLAEKLRGRVGMFKVGPELFTA